MKTIRRLVKVWEFVTLLVVAAISIPLGLALLLAAGWLVWYAGDDWFADVFAACLTWSGGTLILVPLAQLAGQPKDKQRAAPNAPGRIGYPRQREPRHEGRR